MADSFETQIDQFVANTKEKTLAVVKQSIKELVFDVQKSDDKGGKMRVDTGFLRSSGAGALNQVPRGPVKGRKRKAGEVGVLTEYRIENETGYVDDLLIRTKFGDTFYFGWTAEYALFREAYDGFLETGLQKWQMFVDKAVKELKDRNALKNR